MTMTTSILLSFLLTIQTQASVPTSGRTSSYTSCTEVPSLHCRNGSTCIAGTAKFSPSDLSALKHIQTHESGYHCDCLPGYTGHECEIEVSSCGNGYDPNSVSVHSCYYGSECKQHQDMYYCDCETINALSSSAGEKYAGLMCQHEATSMCAVSLAETYAPNGQFCTNHGKCVKLVTGDDPHPGCECKEGWHGERCELKLSESPIPKLMGYNVGSGGSMTGRVVLLSLLIICMLAIVIAVISMLIKINREQKKSREKAMGKTSAEVGVGDLEPDGSGTLGHGSATTVEEGEGDLEMKESVGGTEDGDENGVKTEEDCQENGLREII